MSGLHLESRSKHKIQITTTVAKEKLVYAPIIEPYMVFIPFSEDFLDVDMAGGARYGHQ